MPRSTLTDRYRTTIPAEVRIALNVKPGQGLIHKIQDETATVRAESGSLLDRRGVLKSDRPAGSRDEERAVVAQHLAENYRRFLRQ